jgi:hypothetical protein
MKVKGWRDTFSRLPTGCRFYTRRLPNKPSNVNQFNASAFSQGFADRTFDLLTPQTLFPQQQDRQAIDNPPVLQHRPSSLFAVERRPGFCLVPLAFEVHNPELRRSATFIGSI